LFLKNDSFSVFSMFHVPPAATTLFRKTRCVAANTQQIAFVFMLLASACLLGGCRLGADCDLDAYPAYGGTWQRTVRDAGRVGSVFDPGGSRAADLAARADSDENDARNRAQYSEDNADGDDENRDPDSDPDSDNDANRSERDEENRRDLDDSDQQEMEERFRNLDLQDINYQAPGPDDSRDWR